jgi:HPt (histidine-containing phosphotransfer) domain-containing protein
MSNEELHRLMAAVNAEFRAVLPARIAAIDALWEQIARDENTAQCMQELSRAVHALAGSAETFGCAAVGKAAAAAEAALEPHRDAGSPPEAVQAEIAQRLEALRRVAGTGGRG